MFIQLIRVVCAAMFATHEGLSSCLSLEHSLPSELIIIAFAAVFFLWLAPVLLEFLELCHCFSHPLFFSCLCDENGTVLFLNCSEFGLIPRIWIWHPCLEADEVTVDEWGVNHWWKMKWQNRFLSINVLHQFDEYLSL